MTADEVALLILAGGRSERFGHKDKLLAELNGIPLGLHIANQLAGFPWRQRIAVTSGALSLPLSECDYTVVPAVEAGGMGDNIAAAVRTLGDVRAVLIVLADMPFVSHGHIQHILTAAADDESIVASRHAGLVSPPVLFGRNHFETLKDLSGDAGAKRILVDRLSQLTWVEARPAELADIDTPADFQRARRSDFEAES